MKLAYSSLACPQWSIEEAVNAAIHYHYEAIEWRLADGEIIEPATPPTVLKRLQQVPAEHGIEVACLDTSCSVVQSTPEARRKVIEQSQQMLDIASEIGTRFLRLFGGRIPSEQTREDLLGPTAEVLHTIGGLAAAQGITVMLETHDDWTKSADVLALMQAASSPAVKVLWDSHHTYRSGEQPQQTVETLGTGIAYVHVKDSRSRITELHEETWDYKLITEGTVPIDEICKVLKQSGYDGYLSLEWEKKWHPEITEPEIALPQAVPWLRRFWTEA